MLAEPTAAAHSSTACRTSASSSLRVGRPTIATTVNKGRHLVCRCIGNTDTVIETQRTADQRHQRNKKRLVTTNEIKRKTLEYT